MLSGMLITVFATVPMQAGANTLQGDEVAAPASMWIEFADRIMDFTLDLLAMEWTPIRVGVFFIIVGMILEGVGVYALISATK